ncbi:MAG TPA: carboxymuconolactone decarboxylase family protein [Steroidobacteraceae bacterium]
MDNTALDLIRESIPEYARDLKLNLGSVLTPAGAPGLSERQIWAVALASAIASRNNAFTAAIEAAAAPYLDAPHLQAARAAAAIMGMNNVYYRFLHLVEDAEYAGLPARLRMNVLGNPGIDKLDFELLSLAVSAINACGLCITSHEKKLRANGMTREMIQSAVRIASVVHAVARVLEYGAGGSAAASDAVAA